MKTKPITLFVPFTKIERRAEDDALIVEGYCFVNPTVKGDRYSVKRSAMEAATPEYLKFPAVREMHQPIAAGTGLEIVWDERGCLLRSECVDEGTKKKIDKKVLRGYSIGISNLTVNRADEVEACDWVETSYVDRPKDPDAVFLHRAEGFDPDAEVEVTVIDEPTSPADVPTQPGAEAVPDQQLSLHPSGSLAPSDEPSPLPASAAPGAGEGVSSPPDAASRLWAKIAGGVPEETPEEERRLFLVETLTSLDIALPIAAEMAAGVDVMRALTSDEVPVRENLEGRKPRMYADCRGDRNAEGLAYSIHDAHMALMDSMDSILGSDEADKAGLIQQSAKQYADHITEMCKAKMARGELAAEIALARADKPAGDYGANADYADPGYQSDKKPRYPLDTKEHVKAAWSYINQADNAGKYSSADLAKVRNKIMAAAKKVGIEISDEAKARAAAVADAPPAEPETVSRSTERDDPTEIQRLTASNAELLQRLATQEEAVTRLAASEAEVQRLRNAPLDPEKPPVRFAAALEREFRANQSADGADDITAIRRLYQAAQERAKTEPDLRLREAAGKRVALLQMALHELGDLKA